MLNPSRLSEKDKLFVDLYCLYGEADGKRASMEAEKGRKGLEGYFLTRPAVLDAIAEKGGPAPIVNCRKLTAKEHMFVDKYLETLSIPEAAKAAKIDERVAREWLKRPYFKVEIEQRLSEVRANSIVKAEEVIEELAMIGFADITDYCTFGANGIQIKESVDMGNTGAISEVSQGQHGVKFKLHNKMTALEHLAKYLGLTKDRIELTGEDGAPIQIESPIDSINAKLDALAANNGNRTTLMEQDEEAKEEEE